MSVINYVKHPYHGVGFSSTPELLKALQVLERHQLYKIGAHIVEPILHGGTRAHMVRAVRNAIVGGDDSLKIRDEDTTKNGHYRSDWIVLDDYAMRICALRSGGYGAILEARETFENERNEYQKSLIEPPMSAHRRNLIARLRAIYNDNWCQEPRITAGEAECILQTIRELETK